jgi:hypothetical protein
MDHDPNMLNPAFSAADCPHPPDPFAPEASIGARASKKASGLVGLEMAPSEELEGPLDSGPEHQFANLHDAGLVGPLEANVRAFALLAMRLCNALQVILPRNAPNPSPVGWDSDSESGRIGFGAPQEYQHRNGTDKRFPGRYLPCHRQ